ncbi:MAG: hypothetical protein Q9182_007034 [Xanthomendoza sp. 2 TL-2023]
MNNATSQSPLSQAPHPSENTSTVGSSQSEATYITTNGRHMQYINASILPQVTERRKRAIKESQHRKSLTNDRWERQRMHQYLVALGTKKDGSVTQGSPQASIKVHEIMIEGLGFRVLKGGSKLARVYGPSDTLRSTPKRANVQGVTFVRSKGGNLYRSGVVHASKYVLTKKSISTGQGQHEPRKLTFARSIDKAKKLSSLCKSFTKTGACRKRKCDLPHVDRAGQIRKHAVNPADTGSTINSLETSIANDSDLSSGEDDFADTDRDDIDSDDLNDEFSDGVDVSAQQGVVEQDDFVSI